MAARSTFPRQTSSSGLPGNARDWVAQIRFDQRLRERRRARYTGMTLTELCRVILKG